MKLTLAILALASLASTACAQSISVKSGTVTLTQPVTLRARTLMTAFSCQRPGMPVGVGAPLVMEPGDIAICTVKFNQTALSSILVGITFPDGLTGPATITVPPGVDAWTFTVTATDLPPVAGLLPLSYSIWTPTEPAAHYVNLALPCCARADLCGHSKGEVSWDLCSTN